MKWRRSLPLLVIVGVGSILPILRLFRHPEARPAPATPAASRLVTGTSGNYPPLSSWTGSTPTGFAPSIALAFAKHEHREVAWTRFAWPDLARDFEAGRFTVVADGITVRADRSLAGRFTVPIARGGVVLLVRAGDAGLPGELPAERVRSLDRSGFRVVVNQGGHLERVARGLFRSAEVRPIADNGGVRDALARGDADAAMTNTFEAPLWARGLDHIERVGPLTSDVTALWLRADEEGLAERLDAWLLDEEESGALGLLRAQTLGEGAPTARPVSALLAATVERLALMPLVAATKQHAGTAIADGAQEERVLAASAAALARAAAARGRPAPSRAVGDRFFRAQIEAAKAVQARAPAASGDAPSLEALRAAIARITARMALLAVRVPRDTTADAVRREATDWLAETGLDADHVREIAAAIAAFDE